MAISGGDGSITLTTKVDESGLKKGTNSLRSEAMKLAAEYRKAGMSQSEAQKRAYKELGITAKETDKVTKKTKEFGNESEKSGSKASRAYGGVKSAISAMGRAFAVVGVAGLTAFAGITKAAVDSYAEYEQLSGGVQKIFDEIDYSKIAEDAGNAYKTMGMSANEYLGVMTTVGANFASTLGDAKGYEVAKQGMQAISDFASGTGRSVDELSEKYQMITKSTSSYQSIADQFAGILPATSAGFLEQAQAAGFLSDSYTKLTDVPMAEYQEAVTQMLSKGVDALGLTGNTAMEASTTLSGSMAMMKASWQNLLTGIVDSNEELPKLMDNFAESVVTVFDNVIPAVQKVLKNLPKVVSKLGKEIIEIVPDTFGDMVPEIIDGALLLVETAAKTISKNARKIGEGFAEVLKITSKSIIDLIPIMAKAGKDIVLGIVKGISGSMPVLSTAVMGIGTVFLSLKVASFVSSIVGGFQSIMGVLNAYQAAVAASQHVSILLASTMTPLQLAIGVLTGKVSLATAAQAAWNAVLYANPIMVAVGAIALLAGAVVGALLAYESYLEKNSEIIIATQNIANASQEAAQKTQELNDSLLSISENAESTIMSIEAEAYANNALATELYNLAEQSSLTSVEKERMSYIVNELNDSVSSLNLVLDKETGQLNMTEEAVKDVIAQKLELARTNAIQEIYTEQLKKQYEAELQAVENAQKLAEAQSEYNEILSQGEEKTIDVMGTTTTYTSYTTEQSKALENLKEAIKNYSDALGNAKSNITQSQTNLENFSKVTGSDVPQSFITAKEETKGFFDALNTQTGEASKKSKDKGMDFGDGYVKGINSKKSEAYQAGYNLGIQALKGTQDAQRSKSPAKETIELGTYYGDGYVIGIDKKQKEARNSGIELAKTALNGTIQTIKRTKQIIINSFKYLISDTRTEVQKVVDEMNEELLESERFYNEESERLKDSKLESDKEYLDNLKEIADKERKLYDARKKDVESLKETIVNAYSDMASEALDSISELQKTQESFAEKLAGYGDLTYEKKYTNKYGMKVTENRLSDLSDQTEFLEEYYDMLMAVKDRGNVPKEFFSAIRDMGLEEGLEYANSLLELSDEDFANYIREWERKQETAKNISKALYEDEATELATSINDEFDSLKDDMFGIGKDSAGEFGDGFIQQLKFLAHDIRYALQSALGGVTIGGIGSVISGEGDVIKVPALARGGIAPRKMLAMIGERGREAVLPLENNTGWMDVLADRISARMGGASSTVVLEVDGREFGRAVVEQGNRENRRIGTRLVSR